MNYEYKISLLEENQRKEPNALLNTRKEKNGENKNTSEREVGFGD